MNDKRNFRSKKRNYVTLKDVWFTSILWKGGKSNCGSPEEVGIDDLDCFLFYINMASIHNKKIIRRTGNTKKTQEDITSLKNELFYFTSIWQAFITKK
ncbi:uncharacterized protein LOC130648411 isoform X2 [Hydractinia symbiolongicarpus]|uniref:uncharacterized protein LOC130648411 isoform X2 n=1 Tax=Hydractinia symbiolongicarpus TaxID=13093 RepID=UPI00254FC980|nr:uncharacterized protein LOC130648411 isoform X2 [Hydractinia symbiolongicarpus]